MRHEFLLVILADQGYNPYTLLPASLHPLLLLDVSAGFEPSGPGMDVLLGRQSRS